MHEFNLSDYLVANKGNQDIYPMVPRITCKDGFSLSVQCNSGSYCQPREDRSDGYYKVEVGFPSAKPEFFSEYAETSWWDDEEDGSVSFFDYTNTVYGYVPIELVEKCILLHGGVMQLALENPAVKLLEK